jgi:hypothetical protein
VCDGLVCRVRKLNWPRNIIFPPRVYSAIATKETLGHGGLNNGHRMAKNMEGRHRQHGKHMRRVGIR